MIETAEKKKKSALSQEQKREIVELTIETYHKEQERQREENYDRRLHNTKLLMEKYKGFVVHSESAVYDASQVSEDEEFNEIVDLMDCGGHGISIESVRQSVARTRVIIHHIDTMLQFYEFKCNQSGKAEDARRFRVLKGLYLNEERKSPDDIAAEEGVDVRTIYRDQNAALRDLSALIFGYFE